MAALVLLANEVLNNYNKSLLNTFMDTIENVIIVELFLNEQNEFYMNQFNESKIINSQNSKRKKKANSKTIEK